MKKHLQLLMISFALATYSFSQETDIIRSLKNKLKNVRGFDLADCLNELASEYRYSPASMDSMHAYAQKANNLSRQLNYKRGLARSLTFIGAYQLVSKKDTTGAKKYYSASERIGNEISDNHVLGWNYLALSEMYTSIDGMMQSFLKMNTEPVYVTYLKKANTCFVKAKDERGELESSTWLCLYYLDKSFPDPDEAFIYCERTVALSHLWANRDMPWKQIFGTMPYTAMSRIFEAAGDYESALDYLRKGKAYNDQYKTEWDMSDLIGMLYSKMNRPDSAFYYLTKNYDPTKRIRPGRQIELGTAYLLNKDQDKALSFLKPAVDSLRTARREVSLPWALLTLSKAYEGKRDYKTAIEHAREGYQLATIRKRNTYIMEGAEILSRLFHQVKQDDSAYHYLKQYITLKDSANNKQYLQKLNIKLSEFKRAAENARRETQLGFLYRDNKLKQQQLKQEAQSKYFLILGLASLILIGFYVLRSQKLKRKNEMLAIEKTKAELQQKVSELEMQALRAQMNPHFIFNCLSSINRFILRNETEAASDFLTRFSRLIRLVLIHSQKQVITLEDEIETLRLYLDMERMRFKNSFDYHIIYSNTVDAGNILIPPMLLQPFCENAIWHGLMHKDSPGRLDITISMENSILHCTICDNGVGRARAEQLKTRSAEQNKSFGLKITQERLTILNAGRGISTFFEIEDLQDEQGQAAGTKVILKISSNEPVEAA